MKFIICAIKDNAINAFQQIWNVRAEGEAMRAFADAINKEGTPMNAHAEDYDLYTLATYDDSTGIIEPHTPQQLTRGVSVKI